VVLRPTTGVDARSAVSHGLTTGACAVNIHVRRPVCSRFRVIVVVGFMSIIDAQRRMRLALIVGALGIYARNVAVPGEV